MDTLLVGGDHALDGRGLPVAVTGERELIQRALIRLSVRRGAFAPDPALGSELYKLSGARSDLLERLALSYAQEALAPMPQVGVYGVQVERQGNGTLLVGVGLSLRGQVYPLEMEVR